MINWHQYIWSHHYWIIFISVSPSSCLMFMFFSWRPLEAWCAFEHLSLGHRWSLEAEKTSPAFESCFSRPLNRSNSPTENTPTQLLSILKSKFLSTDHALKRNLTRRTHYIHGETFLDTVHLGHLLVWNMWVTIQPFSSDMSDIHMSFSGGGGGGAQFSRFWKFTRDVRQK